MPDVDMQDLTIALAKEVFGEDETPTLEESLDDPSFPRIVAFIAAAFNAGVEHQRWLSEPKV